MGKGYFVLITQKTGAYLLLLCLILGTVMCNEVIVVFLIIFVCDITDFFLLSLDKHNLVISYIFGGIQVERHNVPLHSFILLNIYAIYCIYAQCVIGTLKLHV